MDDDDLKVTFKSVVDGAGRIHVETSIFGQCIKLIFDTQEKAIRDGLIELGWTPPKE